MLHSLLPTKRCSIKEKYSCLLKSEGDFVRKKYVLNLGLTALALGLVIPPVFAQGGERDAQNMIERNQHILGLPKAALKMEQKASLVMYDKDNQIIQSYSEEEWKELGTEIDIHKDSEVSTSGKPYAEIFDENGLLLDPPPNIEKEVKGLSDAGSRNLFVFRHSSFSNQLSIGQGKSFDHPKSLIIEPVGQVETLHVNLIDSTGQITGSMQLNDFSESIKIPLDSFTELDSYSIQLINKSQTEPVELVGGVVIYD